MSKLLNGFAAAALLLLFLCTFILVNNNSIVFGQSESMSDQMSAAQNGGIGKLISSLTEWTGTSSIGIVVGLLAFKTNTPDKIRILERKRIILSVAILSLSVGAIHLLLVQQHAKESFWWGIIFFISGIAQIGFGIIIMFVKKPQINNILYYIGIIGNASLDATFILVRLFTPPFSQEGTPINELEPNGIITIVIEIIIVILLIYIVKFKEEEEEVAKNKIK